MLWNERQIWVTYNYNGIQSRETDSIWEKIARVCNVDVAFDSILPPFGQRHLLHSNPVEVLNKRVNNANMQYYTCLVILCRFYKGQGGEKHPLLTVSQTACFFHPFLQRLEKKTPLVVKLGITRLSVNTSIVGNNLVARERLKGNLSNCISWCNMLLICCSSWLLYESEFLVYVLKQTFSVTISHVYFFLVLHAFYTMHMSGLTSFPRIPRPASMWLRRRGLNCLAVFSPWRAQWTRRVHTLPWCQTCNVITNPSVSHCLTSTKCPIMVSFKF